MDDLKFLLFVFLVIISYYFYCSANVFKHNKKYLSSLWLKLAKKD